MDDAFFTILYDYKTLKIQSDELKKLLKNPFCYSLSNPIVVTENDIRYVIELYENNSIDLVELTYWANVLKLSEIYTYPDDSMSQERIARVIDMIEDIEIFHVDIDSSYINKMKQILNM